MGVIGMRLPEGKGEVVGTLVVDDSDEILAMTSSGVLIRTQVDQISSQGRSATGVKVMSPDDHDQVASVALVTMTDDEDDEELGDEEPGDEEPGDEAEAVEEQD